MQPSAFFTRSVPGMDALLDNADLRRENGILASKHVQTEARSDRKAVILLVGEDREQLGCAVATFGRDNSELAICPRIAFDSIVR